MGRKKTDQFDIQAAKNASDINNYTPFDDFMTMFDIVSKQKPVEDEVIKREFISNLSLEAQVLIASILNSPIEFIMVLGYKEWRKVQSNNNIKKRVLKLLVKSYGLHKKRARKIIQEVEEFAKLL